MVGSVMILLLLAEKSLAAPFYGPSVPDAPGGSQGDQGSPASPGNPGSPGSPGQGGGGIPGQPGPGPYNPLSNGQEGPGNPQPGTGTPSGNGQGGSPESTAPTFMNGTVPNTKAPFATPGISPGTFTAPITSLYELQGVPALAAPLMGQVFRPFGMSLYQPDAFQVVPQGLVSLTGTLETDTNIDFSSTNPQVGSLYTITPAVAYSTLSDYGYFSGLASVSYDQYVAGPPISSYLDELGGLDAGTYLGNRIFVGVMDFALRGNSPDLSGAPVQFLNGIEPIFTNTLGGEVGLALTPQITFVETALDYYFDGTAFGAGISNLESLSETLEYVDRTNMLTASYTYTLGTFSLYPDFISYGVAGSAMHSLSPSASIGALGGYTEYIMQGDPLLDFTMINGAGTLNYTFTPLVSAALEGGYNVVTFATGQSYPGPLLDATLSYMTPRLSVILNAGWFEENQMTYGIEMGPVDIKQVMATLRYVLSQKTYFIASGAYTDYSFFQAPSFSNSFFKILQAGQNYTGSSVTESDGVFWTPKPWITTGLEYNFISFTSNIPIESVVDNQFIALVSLNFPF
ncbi:MAG: hypothetical protein ACYDBP_00155 [Leptospirales bacterium]